MEPKTPNIKNNAEKNNAEDEAESTGDGATPINLQKRKGDVDPTRYGDWELNGRCVDF